VRSLGGFTENVYLPTGAPSIYVNGSLKTVTTDYTIGSTGIVTFVSAPANAAPLTWTGNYNWLCYFDDDILDLASSGSGWWEVKSLNFSSVLLG